MVDSNTYEELKKFAEGIISCIESVEKEGKTSSEMLVSLKRIIRIHLALKELDYKQYALDMEKAHEKSIRSN